MNGTKPSLKDILISDLATAKAPDNNNVILSPGMYVGKVLGFTEEETYQYITVEIDKKKYNFFYNYTLKDSEDLNADVINWLKALATIPTAETTSMLEIANSAIGSSYKFEVYNYTSKTGKNAGKQQHAISFKTLPVIETVVIQDEPLDLPF